MDDRPVLWGGRPPITTTTTATKGAPVRKALQTTIRRGMKATGDTLELVVDGTIGRLLDTDPRRVR